MRSLLPRDLVRYNSGGSRRREEAVVGSLWKLESVSWEHHAACLVTSSATIVNVADDVRRLWKDQFWNLETGFWELRSTSAS